MPNHQEWNFYELMWRIHGRGRRLPLPWWIQQYFRAWQDDYDHGLFGSREAAFASNAHYRYWSMVGVKDHRQECLIGQAGEIEPVYDRYAMSFFLFDPVSRQISFPQYPELSSAAPTLVQSWERNYLPVHQLRYDSPGGYRVEQRTLATTVGIDQKSFVLVRLRVSANAANRPPVWLCISISPSGPTGFERNDRARAQSDHRWITFLRYLPSERRMEVNRDVGPLFDRPPDQFGMYGNGHSTDPDFYLQFNPSEELRSRAELNGSAVSTDFVAGYCQGVLTWELTGNVVANGFSLDIRLPIDDFRGQDDLDMLKNADPEDLERNNREFWVGKLDGSGLQAILPAEAAHLMDLYRVCRAAILILSDHGEIHPGPTIYDSFWIRDSSIEGIACALAGDIALAGRQFGEHYTRPGIFHQVHAPIGPNSLYGFFGGKHEQDDHEWDSNGQALWAFGRFDRIRGHEAAFGASIFSPYIVDGARWLRDNRSEYGLLKSGWSAEHLGEKDKPHYWDDLWALAGLWEAAQLATRLGAPQREEIWHIYDDIRIATANSIRWVLTEQRRQGFWETFIPTGPADAGRLDSTMIGALAYFHPCRLYDGMKLGHDIDVAARMTLETIWSHFVQQGGLRHDSAWYCFAPYLTLQLAHAFLLTGDPGRMDQCLGWATTAGYAATRPFGQADWQAVLGAWNEQHCYPVATDFAEVPGRWWYMGDIPHGWAAAEMMLLLRDILFFEADEDRDPHIYIAPGVMPHWVTGGEGVTVSHANTTFGAPFGYELGHDERARTVTIEIRESAPPSVRYIYPCRMGQIISAQSEGRALVTAGTEVMIPAGTEKVVVQYA